MEIRCPAGKYCDYYDVIVVLGAAVWKDGQPSPADGRRVLHAVDLLRKGRADFLLATGVLGKYPSSEARVMWDIALNEGVSRGNSYNRGGGDLNLQECDAMLSYYARTGLVNCSCGFRSLSSP
jgi:hypothetical protein